MQYHNFGILKLKVSTWNDAVETLIAADFED